MQLYCKKCLEMITISKYYPVSWFCFERGFELGEKINDFLEEHSEKCYSFDNFKKEKFDTMSGTDMFGFRTETDDDGFFSDYSEQPYKIVKK